MQCKRRNGENNRLGLGLGSGIGFRVRVRIRIRVRDRVRDRDRAGLGSGFDYSRHCAICIAPNTESPFYQQQQISGYPRNNSPKTNPAMAISRGITFE